MEHRLTCRQVLSLMDYYIEDKISEKLKFYIEMHLKKCKKCKDTYENAKNVTKNLFENNSFEVKQYINFRNNISAYIDNELNDDENLRIRKIAISNPLARRDLENIYKLKNMMHNSFKKTHNDIKENFTDTIIKNIEHNTYKRKRFPIFKVSTLFAIILISIITSLVAILYF